MIQQIQETGNVKSSLWNEEEIKSESSSTTNAMRFQSSTNTNYQWFAGIECIMPRQSLRFKNLSRAIAVMLNVDMYTETPCKKTLEIYCDIFCHHHHQIAIIINHHHHYHHHHDHHNLTVQAGTMKQGILPRNHLPVKAVIGVMGAAVRHISWSNIITNVICLFVLFKDMDTAVQYNIPKKFWALTSSRLEIIRNSHHICECHVANQQVGACP